MAKSKKNNTSLSLFYITLVALSVLVIKAYVRLPLSQDGVTARGLYHFLNNTQFIETAITTFFVVGFFCIKVIKTSFVNSWVLAFGFSAINLGIMIIDARAQKYNIFVENYIRQNYGGAVLIYFIAILSLICGVLTISFGKRKI